MITFSDKLLAAWSKVKPTEKVPLLAKAGDTATLYLCDVIGADPLFGGGISTKSVADALADAKSVKTLKVNINSVGGDFFEATGIVSLLADFAESHTVTAHVLGLAASAASFIACSCPEVVMAPDATMMVHHTVGGAFGHASDIRAYVAMMDKMDGVLEQLYARCTGQSVEDIRALLAAETWFTADEAVKAGFADSIEGDDPKPQAKPSNVTPPFVALAAQTRRVTSRQTEIDLAAMQTLRLRRQR